MKEQEVTIINKSGLHARPAAQFVKLASTFQSDVKVIYRGKTVNAKSMIDMMLAAAPQGETIRLQTNGLDEDAALQAMVELIKQGLNEL